MSSVADFTQVYERSRATLLIQLYAYCADPGLAHEAVDEAFITASRHWHRIGRLPAPEPWIRSQAIRFVESRPHRRVAATGAVESGSNAHLVRCLAALSPTSRRLLVVRRLGDTDLPAAAREVRLTDGAAEQLLARSASALHAAGIDTTPAGLGTALSALADDLSGETPTPSRTLKRAGTRRRYVFTTALVAALVAGAAGVGGLTHLAATAGATRPPHPTTSPPTTPTTPPIHVTDAQLMTSGQLAGVAGASWRDLGTPHIGPAETVYGACAMAAANPPPNDTHVRAFGPASGGAENLRQVIQLAPSDAEAHRAYRQVVNAFAECADQHLGQFDIVRSLGDEARLIGLSAPGSAGPTDRTVVVSRSGAVVTVLVATTPPGATQPLTPEQLVAAAGASVSDICAVSHGGCAAPPFHTASTLPPAARANGRFLTTIDLPLVARIQSPWTATDPGTPTGNPSATACDMTDFAAAGASAVTSRSYVVPNAHGLPTVFGLTETIAEFSDPGAATTLLRHVRSTVAGCHQRQLSLSVLQTSTFGAGGRSGSVWQIQQRASKQRVTTSRVALVRVGSRVAEVTFTPGGAEYDVSTADYLALARRTAQRLTTGG